MVIDKILAKIIGTANERELKRLAPTVVAINAKEPEVRELSDDALRARTEEFRARLANGETLDDLLPDAFAIVREAGRRVLNMRHFDVQLIGGMVLHKGKIAEMKTGEGKTLVATLPAYLNALAGKGVHVVTVNDYLARRDSEWMGRIYRFLGMTVGVIQHDLNDAERQVAYGCDITYGTNNEFGFDYLRDNMKFDLAHYVQRGHNFAIVDEVDSILIDEARTPLIISGPAEESTDLYYEVDRIIPKLDKGAVTRGDVKAEEREELEKTGDYIVDEKHKTVNLTESGMAKAEKMLAHRLVPGSGGLIISSPSVTGTAFFSTVRAAYTISSGVTCTHQTCTLLQSGTITGAQLDSECVVSRTAANGGVPGTAVDVKCGVTNTNTVALYCCNFSTTDVTGVVGTWYLRVFNEQ